jgi:hypothetical protein
MKVIETDGGNLNILEVTEENLPNIGKGQKHKI